MKVLVLGGTGDTGEETARLLVASPEVDAVVVAGRSQARADQVAAALGDKASGTVVDIRQEDQLAEVAARADMVVNAAGPDFGIQVRALKAAIAAGVNYADVAGDGRAADQALALDAEARARGTTALIGVGAAPGLSNLIAVHVLRKLDVVSAVHIGWLWGGSEFWRDAGATAATWRGSGHVNAAWESVMGLTRGPVQIYREGKPLSVEPFTHGTEVTWLSGERLMAYPVDNAETRTLPPRLPGVAAVTTYACPWPPQLTELWREQAERLMKRAVDPAEAAIALHDAVAADYEHPLAGTGPEPSPVLWVTALGASGGRAASYTCWPRMSWLSTAAPLATAALSLLRGEVHATGVLPPEAVFEPSGFFARVAGYAGIDASKGPLFDEVLVYGESAAVEGNG
jgi:NAD(P)-dependent dehydrogenase (short-subunit alcohol dehydrogenase family)